MARSTKKAVLLAYSSQLLKLTSMSLVLMIAACGFEPETEGVSIKPDLPQSENVSEWSIIGNGDGQNYFSRLDKINASNVNALGLAWYVDLPIPDSLNGNPLVKDGLVYQSGPLGMVFAHDVATGELRWQHEPEIAWGTNVAAYWGARFNRGLAISGDLIIFATGDCRIHAIDRMTGEARWETQSCEPKEYYTITAAPRIGNGLVFTGNACLDLGANRGYVDALDVTTGERRWRFYTVPGEKPEQGYAEPLMDEAAKTWGTGQWWENASGCGSVWEGITYDPSTNLLFIGTGGPAPWNPAARGENAGDELFTNSIVALNADNGEYVWHYKVTPHDAWNLEASNQMMIADIEIAGEIRHVLLAAPKNGFFYTLDANTGELISADNFMPVNWASGIDLETGRPIPSDEAKWWLKEEGAEVTPSSLGARSWQAMSYNPETGLVYLPANSHSARFRGSTIGGLGGLDVDMYIDLKGEAKYKSYGAIIAWDPVKQEEVWRGRHSPLPINGGILSTSGDLVFQATSDGYFEAYHAKSGEKLWSFSTGSTSYAAPSTVEVDGEQVILLPVGNGVSGSNMMYTKLGSLPETRAPSRLLAFKIGGAEVLPSTEIAEILEPIMARQSEEAAERGRHLAEAYICVVCHGVEGVALEGSVPDLRNSGILADIEALKSVVREGLLAQNGMPYFPDITDEDLIAIQAYFINSAWDSFDEQEASKAD